MQIGAVFAGAMRRSRSWCFAHVQIAANIPP
jgi:hypothetical protein